MVGEQGRGAARVNNVTARDPTTRRPGAGMKVRPFALDYIEEPSAAGADYAWRLYAVAYSTPVLAAIYLWPNRVEPVGWWWLAMAVAAIALALVLGLSLIHI